MLSRPPRTVLQVAGKTQIVRAMRCVVAAIVCVVLYAPTVAAQAAEWVIVPASTNNDLSWMLPTASTVGAAFSQERVPVMPTDRAVMRFEQRGSAPSTEVTDTDIEEWVKRSREAIRHLARGDYSSALKELKEAQALSRKAADELNREKARAQNVLDTCLYMVRALLETGNRSRAKAQVQECVRLVPRGEPSPYMHPPSVVSLYKSATEPGPERSGSLVVHSEPSGCAVRLNGVGFGETPFEMGDLYPGDYQVQVECDPGRRGRVHPVTLQSGQNKVFVDLEFDRAVQTEPLLRLQYDGQSKTARRVGDAQEIAKVLRAGAVVLASSPSIDMLELQVVSGTERHKGFARIPTTANGPTAKVAAEAAASLARGECKDFTGPKPVTIACKGARIGTAAPSDRDSAGWPGNRPPRGQWIAGLALGSAGGATLFVSYGLLIARRGSGDDFKNQDPFNPNDTTLQLKWTNLGNAVGIMALAGGALSVTAMPLVLPYKSKTPWWAWLSGGLGVGAAVVSIVSGVTAKKAPAGTSDCQLILDAAQASDCVDRDRSIDRAIVLAATAAPLLTIPLVYLFRKDEKKRDATIVPNIMVARSGATFRVGGEF